ncbi:AP-5 complex subunit sigma-1-like [Protopterus annectens]|uniref:AP-5 complex subunit sigma-1-like n=1 Tax=Protopterus annectens TaxID=7888 RepID=UPI001CF9DDD8|nr:AP-5 complex subunit sigma-1-like [Protopterus annectens]
MVHAFLINTLSCSTGGTESLCRVLYSQTFGSERSESRNKDPEEERCYRKEQIFAVARQVKSACTLSRQAMGKSLSAFAFPPSDEVVALQEADFGVFRLPPGDPFSESKTVLWFGIQSVGFALVCDPYENLMLAENSLKMVVKYLLEYLRLLSQGSDMLKADKIEIILNKFLPCGQLLFINHRFVYNREGKYSFTPTKTGEATEVPHEEKILGLKLSYMDRLKKLSAILRLLSST